MEAPELGLDAVGEELAQSLLADLRPGLQPAYSANEQGHDAAAMSEDEPDPRIAPRGA